MTKQEQGKVNQANGDAFERRVLAKISRSCKYAQRAAGSRGLFDIVGITRKDGSIRLIVCKANGYIEPWERRRLYNWMLKEQTFETVELWFYKTKRTMGHKILTREVL